MPNFCFEELTALPGVAHSLCFSPDGTFLAAGGPVVLASADFQGAQPAELSLLCKEDATRDDGKGTGLVAGQKHVTRLERSVPSVAMRCLSQVIWDTSVYGRPWQSVNQPLLRF